MRPLDITSKEAYLAWVADWKAEYKDLAAKIRDAKERKRRHRDHARALENAGKLADAVPERNLMNAAYWDRISGGWKARRMLDARKEGKEKSAAARALARRPENAAPENAAALENAAEIV